ncbi:MAG: acetate--CoA ligase family protein [Saccharospirillum sp.]|nr:acetate--CoA ligase family protein [Saccharospirillum sp.]
MSPLMKAWQARHIAVIGASTQPSKRGFQVIRALQRSGYDGQIYPVNPYAQSILDLTVYDSVKALPEGVELAVICTPLAAIPDMLQDCADKGIGMAVVVATPGPGEQSLEVQVRDRARALGVRLVGTNTSGLVNPHARINLAGMATPRAGKLALISQSGNVALSIMMQTPLLSHSGLSGYIGVGNQTDLGFADYLALFRDDPNTVAAMLYVEGVGDGREFLQQVACFSQSKPVVVLKAGKSQQAMAAVQSHTGSLAGNYRISADLLRTFGACVVTQPEYLLPVAEVLSAQQISARGHWQVLTDGGGHGSVVADLMVDHRVDFADAGYANPHDLAGEADAKPEVFAERLTDYFANDDIDGVLVTGLFGGYHLRFDESLLAAELSAAERFIELSMDANKPLVVHSLYPVEGNPVLARLSDAGIPVVRSLDLGVQLMQALTERGRFLNRHPTSLASVIRKRTSGEGRWLTEWQARQRLSRDGLFAESEQALMTRADEAEALFAQLGARPLAMKVVSPDILHKSDVGGVVLGVASATELSQAYRRMISSIEQSQPQASLEGVLLTPMAAPGAELVVGILNDAQYGSVLMLGIGGTWVELLSDVAFRALPVDLSQVHEMIDQLHFRALVHGYRQTEPNDLDAFCQWVVEVADWYLSQQDIVEIEFNPVILRSNGFTPVDVRIREATPMETAEDTQCLRQ